VVDMVLMGPSKTVIPLTWEEYRDARNQGKYIGGTMEEVAVDLQQFIETGDMDFDGGDSGGGVVGDGNVDLEDQHNSTSMLREGFIEGSALGQVESDPEKPSQVKGAMEARVASAGSNYFGRSTGYADKIIADMKEEDVKAHRIDAVRAQQLENWQNQRSFHAERNVRQEGEAFGRQENVPYTAGARLEALNQKPVTPMVPAQRLDGEEWKAIEISNSEPATETFEVRSGVDKTQVTEIEIRNPYITFLPYRCVFTGDSHPAFTVEPASGTMERRTGKPVQVLVRFKPTEMVGGATATLVFETEEFRNIYRFVGST